MNGFEGLLAGIIIIQSAVQLVVLYLLYRVVAKLADRTDRLLTKVEPQLDDLAASTRALRDAAAEAGRVVGKATAMAERQLAQLDGALDSARGRLADVAASFERGLLEPTRTVRAVAAGVKSAIATIASARRAPSDATDG